jgi:peptidoglycan/LPS O-acetylase OafA/YrhL
VRYSNAGKLFVIITSNLTLLFLIVYTLIYGLFNGEQLNRLAITLLTALIILLPQNLNFLLNLDSIQMLGNISYALYLIHWPLFVLHRYYDMEMYKDWTDASEASR